jgi:predicted dehydrogenase
MLNRHSPFTRRHFLGTSALSAPFIFTAARSARAQQKADSSETIKVGLVGCGGRGSGAANQALAAYDKNSKLVAVADVLDTQMEKSLANLTTIHGERVDVPAERRFSGLDGYMKLLALDIDVVILASPPGFRPFHLQAAVDAGKHIFAEKPMAVDVAGYKVAMQAVAKAKEKKLNLVAGFCWRYDLARQEGFQRVLDGEIGDIVAASHSYHGGPVKPMPKASTRPAGMADVEWQIRNWYNFSWLSGDGLVEQAVHSVDKLCWAMSDLPPLAAVAVGGRQIPAEGGNIYDHFGIAYEFPGMVFSHMASRQIAGCHGETNDIVVGTKGKLIVGKAGGGEPMIEGAKRWRWKGKKKDMYQAEHDVLFEAVRNGGVVNDGDRMMNSTLVAILGRNAAYTGKRITWEDLLASEEDLAPEQTLKWTDRFEPSPLPMPGSKATL